MGSFVFAAQLLDCAKAFLNLEQSGPAHRRRAVSSAYYAVFHTLAQICTETLLQVGKADQEIYARVYKALDHGPLRTLFSHTPLKDNQLLNEIGPLIKELQNERHKADYSPPDSALFPSSYVEELIKKAEFVIFVLEHLSEANCLMLATCLLFKERKS